MTIILKDNSKEIRTKIVAAGIDICKCCEFNNNVWLDYNPGITDSVHGVGCYGGDTFTNSIEESLQQFMSECTDHIVCKDVDEFINKIKEYSDV